MMLGSTINDATINDAALKNGVFTGSFKPIQGM